MRPGPPEELYALIKNHFQLFFTDNDNNQVREEAAYWLHHYAGPSLCRMAIDYLMNESYSDKEFIQLLDYALGHYEETGMGIYQVIEYLLPLVKNKKTDHKKTGNKILLNNIVDVYNSNIAKYWSKLNLQPDVLFIGALEEYLTFIEKKNNSATELFILLTIQLNDAMQAGIRRDISMIKDNEAQTRSYRDDIGKLLSRIKQLNIDLPFQKRYNNENIYLSKFRQDNKVNIEKEKQEKIKITKGVFDELLEKYRNKYKAGIKEEVKDKLIWNIALSFTGIVLLIAVLVDNNDKLITIVNFIAIAFAAFLGLRIGNYIGLKIARSYQDKNIIGSIVGLYAGVILGNHYKYYLDKVKEIKNISKPYGLETEIPMNILCLFAFAVLMIYGIKAALIIANRKKGINEIKLKPEEQDALNQNIREIDKYFIEKDVFENYQELVRICTLDEPSFETEFTRIKSAA